MPVDRFIHPRIGDSEKIAKLSDAEFRVWFAYLLAADDFGVMPMLASKIRAIDRTLAKRPAKRIDDALVGMVRINLLRRFDHQEAAFLWSPPWQFHQRIRHPRQTHLPFPPEDELVALDAMDTAPTRELFATFHPRVSDAFRGQFGDPEALAKIAEREEKKRRRSGSVPDPFPKRSGNVPGTDPKRSGNVSTLARAGAREWLTANGSRPTATASEEGGPGGTDEASPPLDVWFRELVAAYPPQRVTPSRLTEGEFLEVFKRSTQPAADVWAEMRANLENQKVGHEWRKGMIPSLDKWLREGRWTQRHDPVPLVSERTRQNLAGSQEAVRLIQERHRGLS